MQIDIIMIIYYGDDMAGEPRYLREALATAPFTTRPFTATVMFHHTHLNTHINTHA